MAPPPIPPWAAGLDAVQTRRVQNLIAQELRARGVNRFSFDDEGLEWSSLSGPHRAPLDELAGVCAERDPSAWSELIQAQVEDLLAGEDPDDAPPTLLDGALTADQVRRGRAEPLLGVLPPPPRRRDERLERAAPLGGMRSPFVGAPPSWDHEEEPAKTLPGPPPPTSSSGGLPPSPRPPRRWRLGWPTLIGLAVAVTVALEARNLLRGDPDAPSFEVGPTQDVMLEATPAGEVEAFAERDGRSLGKVPIRVLVPKGTEPVVLLVAAGHRAERVVLPSSGGKVVALERLPDDAPRCTLPVSADGWPHQLLPGGPSTDLSPVEFVGPAAVRIVPEGYGAGLVECPPEGGSVEPPFFRRFPDVATLHVEQPFGYQLFVGDRPSGSVPQKVAVAQAFLQLRSGGAGTWVSRWVAVLGSTEVRLPLDDRRAPPLTVPRTHLEPSEPPALRRTRTVAPEPEPVLPTLD